PLPPQAGADQNCLAVADRRIEQGVTGHEGEHARGGAYCGNAVFRRNTLFDRRHRYLRLRGVTSPIEPAPFDREAAPWSGVGPVALPDLVLARFSRLQLHLDRDLDPLSQIPSGDYFDAAKVGILAQCRLEVEQLVAPIGLAPLA